jgi:hypothetical protein
MKYRAAIITLAVVVIAAGIGAGAYFLRKGTSQHPAKPSSAAPSPGQPQSHPIAHIMITQDAADALAASGADGAAFVRSLNRPETFEVIHRGRAESDLLPAATHVESFKSYAAIQTAFADGTIPSDVRFIQYDDEHWPGTPLAEQEHPFTYVRLAEKLVHRHGLLFMNTPGADLDQVLDPDAGNQYSAYLAEGLPSLAKFADVFEIQAQNSKSVGQYLSFAAQAVRQAKQANPNAIILLGVTAKDSGGLPSSAIATEIAGTVSISDGYWFNIPGASNGSSLGVPIALPVIRDWARL